MWKLKLNTLATWCEEPTHWKRPWCWERPRAGWKGGIREWDVGWHHWLHGHEFEQALGDNEGQRSLMCYSLDGKELGMTVTDQRHPQKYRVLAICKVRCSTWRKRNARTSNSYCLGAKSQGMAWHPSQWIITSKMLPGSHSDSLAFKATSSNSFPSSCSMFPQILMVPYLSHPLPRGTSFLHPLLLCMFFHDRSWRLETSTKSISVSFYWIIRKCFSVSATRNLENGKWEEAFVFVFL